MSIIAWLLCPTGAAARRAPLAPEPFLWGTATAAYQVEGSRSALGRQPSVWDAFDTNGTSEVIKAVRPDGAPRVYDWQNAGVADDDFNRFEDTAALVQDVGFGAARLSLSWPRLATYDAEGLEFRVNFEGVAHYRRVLRAYTRRGLKVACTMWHWDLPLALEARARRENSSAWLRPWLPLEFGKYATLLLKEFSGDVDYWITLNEPLTIVQNGYSSGGSHAPGRCSDRDACYAGDDATEPYVAAKNLILAHAHAFRAWRRAGSPGRGCGMTLNSDNCVAFDSSSDETAATRCLEFQSPLFFDPIFYGKWPDSVFHAASPRLNDWNWTSSELDLVQGAHDEKHFFLNTYTSRFVRELSPSSWCANVSSFACDPRGDVSGYNFTDGAPIGTPSSNGWLYNYGRGVRSLLNFHHQRYPNRTFIITENGWGNASSSLQVDLADAERCRYYRDYVSNVSAASVLDGVDVAAYFAWSILDNFEWADGFSTRFGLVHVDYDTQVRTPKTSAAYFRRFITPATSLSDTLVLPSCDDDDHSLPQQEVGLLRRDDVPA